MLVQRLFATVFIVGFFAALPLWFLSTVEGWIDVDCTRGAPGNPFTCVVTERFAFGSNRTERVTLGARAASRHQTGRGRTLVSYQLELDTPYGRERVLDDYTDSAELPRAARDLDAAIRGGAPQFHASVPPPLVFWLAVGLVVIFAGAGLGIALLGNRAPPGRRSGRKG